MGVLTNGLRGRESKSEKDGEKARERRARGRVLESLKFQGFKWKMREGNQQDDREMVVWHIYTIQRCVHAIIYKLAQKISLLNMECVFSSLHTIWKRCTIIYLFKIIYSNNVLAPKARMHVLGQNHVPNNQTTSYERDANLTFHFCLLSSKTKHDFASNDISFVNLLPTSSLIFITPLALVKEQL